MAYFMDRYDFDGGTAGTDVAAAHSHDLEVQQQYGVTYCSYWFDYERQSAFCLIDAPSAEAAAAVHRASHGSVANEIIPVDPDEVARFMGRVDDPATTNRDAGSGLRVIMFTDIEGSTALGQRLGDDAALAVVRLHDSVVRDALAQRGGREVKHLGDGITASFASVADALSAALDIQDGLGHSVDAAVPMPRVRIGISAGEPVADGHDLFGTAVQMAARLCALAEPTTIVAAGTVVDLAAGKGFRFGERQAMELRGFDEMVPACTVIGGDSR